MVLINEEFPHGVSNKFSTKELTERLVKFIDHCCAQKNYFFASSSVVKNIVTSASCT